MRPKLDLSYQVKSKNSNAFNFICIFETNISFSPPVYDFLGDDVSSSMLEMWVPSTYNETSTPPHFTYHNVTPVIFTVKKNYFLLKFDHFPAVL